MRNEGDSPNSTTEFDVKLLVSVIPILAFLAVELRLMLRMTNNPVESGVLLSHLRNEVICKLSSRLATTKSDPRLTPRKRGADTYILVFVQRALDFAYYSSDSVDGDSC